MLQKDGNKTIMVTKYLLETPCEFLNAKKTMKTTKNPYLVLLFLGLFLSACVAPPEKTSPLFTEENLFQEEETQAQVIGLSTDEDLDVGLVKGEENSPTRQLEDARAERSLALPVGIQLMSGELNGTTETTYHIASQEELQEGRKTAQDAAQLLALGLQPTVYFAFDQAMLSEDSKKLLLAYVRVLFSENSNRSVHLILEGHTDQVGTTQYNLSLGLRRALSVKRFMLDEGVDDELLRVESFGEERPVFEELKEDYQRYNRRVEIYFTSKEK